MIQFKDKKYLVLGTSTDIGKTYFVTQICQKLRQKNIKIDAIKPLISGFDSNDPKNDTIKILKALNRPINPENIAKTSPFRLKTPLSPLKAAILEQKTINFDEIVNFCQQNPSKTLLIEGAGGVMTPINQQKTYLDLAKSLKIPVLLVTNTYLGAINHTLCAIEALKTAQITPKIIINNHQNHNLALKSQDIAQEIENFSQIPCFLLDKIIENA